MAAQAYRSPALNFANKISTFRILTVPFFIACLVYFGQDPRQYWYLRFAALAIFVVAVISDVVDGYIARKSKDQSPAGLILDPLGDKLLLMSAFVCLYFSPLPVHFPLYVLMTVISRDIIILLGAVVIFMVKQRVNIAASKWGKLTTFLQIAAVLAVLLQVSFARYFWWAAVAATVISGVDYIIRGFKVLYAVDTAVTAR